jgi:RND family efflux transporter MFP subunit
MNYKILVVSILTIVLFSGCFNTQEEVIEKPSVKIVKMLDLKNSGSFLRTFTYPSEVYAFQDSSLAFEVNGKIVKFYYKEGQKVKKGSVIAKLDDTIYKANYNAARANYNQALIDYNRYKKLLESKSVAKVKFEKQRQNLQLTKAAIQVAKKNLDETKLLAEFDGVLAKKMVNDFARVTAKQAIVRLQDNSSYKIKFFVPESDIRKVKGELSIEHISSLVDFYITLGNDTNKKYEAKLINISTTAEQVTRTFEATLQMQLQDNVTILPGMTAQVTAIEKEKHKKRVFIPYKAVFSDNTNYSFIWGINENNRVYKQQIQTGSLSGDFVEVIGGLDGVLKIVTSGVRFLEANDEVKEYEKIGD